MTVYLGNEETLVEIPAIEFLRNLPDGYTFIHGSELIPEKGERESYSSVILSTRLRDSLKRLNPWMSDTTVNKAALHLEKAEHLGTDLLSINEAVYDSIVNLSTSLDETINGRKESLTVRYIDFQAPENNEFLVTRQFKVQGPNETVIPDIVVFINGIPVVVLECKSPFLETSSTENKGKWEAFQQLQRYMDNRGATPPEGAERLFYTNFFTGILNKYHAYIGTISCNYQNYLEWKDPFPFAAKTVDPDCAQNLLLLGTLTKTNLLDLMENFILYEGDVTTGKKIKKICRYQQYRAVNKALKGLMTAKTKEERGGVIWHTQGSGKSLTMVLLSRKIRRTPGLSDSTIVVVTDRIDLDKQITGTFIRTLEKITTPIQADSVKDLMNLLTQAAPQIILTTIFKFASVEEATAAITARFGEREDALRYTTEFPVLTNKSNVIVLADEAHRSQYKEMAMNMRSALPNAAFIGFTGTPIDKEYKSTRQTFGDYIDRYSIQQSVEDGATVMIVYEGRKPDLHIKDDTLMDIFDDEFSDRTEAEREAIKSKYATKRSIVEADSRIQEIMQDILEHYRDTIYTNKFKAQIVCASREACVKYKKAFDLLKNEVLGKEIGNRIEAQIIFYSGAKNDKAYLKEHHTSKSEKALLIDQFTKPADESSLCFLIVKDMLLTGFDAPVEQVMYLDRPLKEHSLLQAIARVNRICGPKKKCGYIVDYYGVSDYLQEALAIFDTADIGTPMTSIDELYRQMQAYHRAIMSLFHGIDRNNLDALVKILEPENRRAEFETAYKNFATSIERILPHKIEVQYLNDLRWVAYIRIAAKARYESDTKLDISDCGEKVKKIISDHIQADGIRQWIEPVTLFDKDFKDKLNGLKSNKAIASAMEHAARRAITAKFDENPKYYTNLLEKLKNILEETEGQWDLMRQKLEPLHEEILSGEKTEAEKLGLDLREFALYSAVKDRLDQINQAKSKNLGRVASPGATLHGGEHADQEGIARELALAAQDKIQENAVVDWVGNSTKSGVIDYALTMLLNLKYHKVLPIEERKPLVADIMALARKHYAK
jgi:type I restriction enzyme R subunit